MLARSNAELLQDEIEKLGEWRDRCVAADQFPIWFDNILHLRRELAYALRRRYYLNCYLQDARALNAVLANPHDNTAHDTLRTRAQLSIGASSPERKAWGAGLMVLGIGILVLSLLVMSTVLACSFPFAGFFLLLAGTASFCIGFSFFRAGLQTGIAKKLDEVATLLPSPG